jgi:HK97 family phage prohead protease
MKEMIRQIHHIEIRATSEDTRSHTFVISNSTKDRHGSILKTEGWDLTNYMLNPVVLYNHKQYSENPDMVIGTGDVKIENNELVGKVNYEPEDINPLAEKIRKKVDHGTLRAVSVGFMPKNGRWGQKDMGEDPEVFYFTEMELMEFSIVTIPSLTSALKKSAEESTDEFIKQFPKTQNTEDKGVIGLQVYKARHFLISNK